MHLIGQAIRHETYGKGVVTDWDQKTLTVCFSSGDKKFLYPDAFARHLTLRDSAMQSKIEHLLDVRAAEKQAHRQAVQQEQERRYRLQTLKITPNAQAAFDVKDPAQALSTWTVSTGTYLSGYSKGEPRVADRMKPNSLCLLTHRAPGQPERERCILGIFMVEEDFFGSEHQNGVIPAHPVYRLALETPVPFWPYFSTDTAKQRWGNMAMRYFPNQTAEQILFDLLSAAAPAELAEREVFYHYFCAINRLEPRCRESSETKE